jgi:HEAT repeat protein
MRKHFFQTKEEQLVALYLKRALEGSSSSVLSLQLIRRFANETPDLFSNAALAILNAGDDSPAQRYLAILLLKQPAVLQYLTSPRRFSKAEAIAQFRYLMTADRSLDIRLARCLPNRNGVSMVALPVDSSERALDILDETSTGRRIIPVLGHLMEHPDTRIASKAALLIGKRVQNVSFAKRLLDPAQDDRMRANAIESLWGLSTDGAHELLRDHAHDHSNRVAGNAVFGLHILGDESAARLALEMSSKAGAEFRQTSAWVMARIGSPEFVPSLHGLVKDESPGVRIAALRALVNIRKQVPRELATRETMAASADASTNQAQPIQVPDRSEPAFHLRLDGSRFMTVSS